MGTQKISVLVVRTDSGEKKSLEFFPGRRKKIKTPSSTLQLVNAQPLTRTSSPFNFFKPNLKRKIPEVGNHLSQQPLSAKNKNPIIPNSHVSSLHSKTMQPTRIATPCPSGCPLTNSISTCMHKQEQVSGTLRGTSDSNGATSKTTGPKNNIFHMHT